MTNEGKRVKVLAVVQGKDGSVLHLSCGHVLALTTLADPGRKQATCVECEEEP